MSAEVGHRHQSFELQRQLDPHAEHEADVDEANSQVMCNWTSSSGEQTASGMTSKLARSFSVSGLNLLGLVYDFHLARWM